MRFGGLKLLTTAALAAGLLAASPAAADTLGQLATESNGCTPADMLQPAVSSGPSYVVPGPGTITSWSTQAFGSQSPQLLTFKVFRPTAEALTYQVIGHDSRQLASPGLNTFPVDIEVRAGDVIGLHPDSGNPTCSFTVTGDNAYRLLGDIQDGQQGGPFGIYADRRLNVTASFTPTPMMTPPVITPPTGQRAVARKRCKQKQSKKARKRCRKKANLLPL
jgi:hypothetical protein